MKQLKKVHSFENLEASDDADIRKHYYYGGRVECFQKEVIDAPKGKPFSYDVNSMYQRDEKRVTPDRETDS